MKNLELLKEFLNSGLTVKDFSKDKPNSNTWYGSIFLKVLRNLRQIKGIKEYTDIYYDSLHDVRRDRLLWLKAINAY